MPLTDRATSHAVARGESHGPLPVVAQDELHTARAEGAVAVIHEDWRGNKRVRHGGSHLVLRARG